MIFCPFPGDKPVARALALMTTANLPSVNASPEGTNGESARAWRHVNSGRYKSEDPEAIYLLVLNQADEKEQRKNVLGSSRIRIAQDRTPADAQENHAITRDRIAPWVR